MMPGPIATQNLVAYRVFNTECPEDRPKAVTLNLDLSAATGANGSPVPLDFVEIQQTYRLPFVQTIFIDNSAQTQELIVTIGISQQVIKAPPNSQGYYAVLCPNPARITFQSANTTQTNLIVILCSHFIPPSVWTGLT
jgi:hypothetical protein